MYALEIAGRYLYIPTLLYMYSRYLQVPTHSTLLYSRVGEVVMQISTLNEDYVVCMWQ